MKPRLRITGIPQNPDPETIAQIEELNRRVTENPLHLYRPEPKQLEFHGARTRIKALIAANRVGKTLALMADCLIQALPIELVPEHLQPFKVWGLPGMQPFQGRVLSPGLTRTMDAAILARLQDLCPPVAFKGGSYEKAFDNKNRVVKFANGAWIDFFSYEQDLQAHSGVELHRVSYDEEPPGDRGQAIREESRMRLVTTHGDEAFSLTPLLGYSYVKEAIVDRAEDDDEITVVQASMYDAPHITAEEIEAVKKDLTEEQIQARVYGKFVHFGGLVYREWDPKRHIVDPPTQKHVKGLDVYVAIDPGVTTTAVVFAGFDGENSMLIFDELYLHDQATVPEYAAQAIRERLTRWGVEPKWVLIDPSARNRTPTTNTLEGIQALYQRAGINAFQGQPDREAGVFEMKRRMQSTEPQMFYVSRDCPVFKWECEKYRIKERPDGAFDVIKESDHLLDAARWIAMARPLPIVSQPSTRYQRNGWVPGTAPAYRGHGPSGPVAPLGSFS